MTAYVRVKQAATGHHLSVPLDHFKAAEDGAYTELKQDAVDAAGDPLPPKYHTSVSSEAGSKNKSESGQQAESQKEIR